jgi:hypothetical protein
MFNFFGRTPLPPPPPLLPVELMNNQSTELYRVGITTDGRVALTLIAQPGNTMTITMTPESCERMIRMLRAVYEDSDDDQSEIQS